MSNKVKVRRHLRTINRGKMGQIKGWKKRLENTSGIIYRNRIRPYIELHLLTPSSTFSHHSEYEVRIYNKINVVLQEKFKIKEQAIEYAVRWMKMHPSG